MGDVPSVQERRQKNLVLILAREFASISWDVAWRGDLIYLFEMSRGVEILRMAGGPSASSLLPTVQEPAPDVDPLAARPVSWLTPDSLVCPAFDVPGQS